MDEKEGDSGGIRIGGRKRRKQDRRGRKDVKCRM
jgi:hypothetical protein